MSFARSSDEQIDKILRHPDIVMMTMVVLVMMMMKTMMMVVVMMTTMVKMESTMLKEFGKSTCTMK